MGRPKICLREWCQTDRLKKLDFLKKEAQKYNNLIILQDNTFIENLSLSMNKDTSIEQTIIENFKIIISQECLKKLKAKYRIFIYNLKNKQKIRKQYNIIPDNADFICKMKESKNWSREEIVIEHLIDFYKNQQNYNKEIEKVQKKSIRNEVLQNELSIIEGQLQKISEQKMYLSKINSTLLELLATAYLCNDTYKDELDKNNIYVPFENNYSRCEIQKKILLIEKNLI